MKTVAIVLERTDADRTEPAWVQAVIGEAGQRRWSVRIVDAAERWPHRATELGPLGDVVAVVWFVRSRNLVAAPAFDWEAYDGLRVLLDHDAIKNWGWQGDRSYEGAWNRLVERDHFDVLITSSATAAARFENEGVRSAWLPKSYDETRFCDLSEPREGVGHFGTLYAARQAMLAATRRAGVRVEHVRVPYARLNAELNRFQACVVCNLDGRSNRWLRRLVPSHPALWFRPAPGIEALYKNFEVAASATALVCDRVEDLDALGFVEGESMLGYADFDELVQQLRSLTPERCRAIGGAGADLVRRRHTHRRRAAEFLDLVERST